MVGQKQSQLLHSGCLETNGQSEKKSNDHMKLLYEVLQSPEGRPLTQREGQKWFPEGNIQRDE